MAAGMVPVIACSGIETKTGVYATLAEARAEGAVGPGIIPEGLPEGATDLRVGYLADGHRWGVLAFPTQQGDSLRKLVREEITAGPIECRPPGRLEWWPLILRSPVDLTALHATGLRVYAGQDARTLFAINWSQGRAYFWTAALETLGRVFYGTSLPGRSRTRGVGQARNSYRA